MGLPQMGGIALRRGNSGGKSTVGRASRRNKRNLRVPAPRWTRVGAFLMMVVGVPFAACGVMMFWTEWDANHRYVETQCEVLDRRVRSEPLRDVGRSSSPPRDAYAPEVLIKYSVDDREYRVWAYSVFQEEIGDLVGEAAALAKLIRFEKGKQYPCWYDPDKPDRAVLLLGYTWYLFVPVFVIGVVLTAGGLWGVIRGNRKL
jgi:hypothetical protein